MDHHERAKRLGLGPERREGRIGQFLTADIGEDLHTFEVQRLHDALELRSGLVAVLQRHGAERDEPVRRLCDKLRDAVVQYARRLHTDLDRHREIALRRRWHDELHVEAHRVHVLEPVAQAAVLSRHTVAPVGVLLGIERLGVGRGEMRERHGRQVEMRRRDRGGGRHRDMRMDVEGEALRAALAAGLAMAARGGRRVFIPLVH